MSRKRHHRALIALDLIPEMGPGRARKLMQLSGVESADQLFELDICDYQKADGIGEQIAVNVSRFDEWDKVDRILEKTEDSGAGLVAYDDEDYPELLKHIYDPPLILWYKGDLNALKTPGIAVVGTRNPGSYGLKQAELWSEKLVQKGLAVNSGLAYGIDAKAHQTAVDKGGKTVAVLGSGIDVIYPNRNKPLAKRIIENNGIILTEFPPGTKPDAKNFPGRNRIVSGMSHGVLVIESGVKGGSMITARYALDQNREVFVIPHQLGYMKGEGCNYLIQNGQGKLVRDIDDILEEISVNTTSSEELGKPVQPVWKQLDLSDNEKKICEVIDGSAKHIDQLSELIGEPTYKLLPEMLSLELKGAVVQKAGKYFETK
ncbi:DNA-processing protein DprA [Rhodohalobacter halophilus]|uniref:DNA-processing protein DprA n=1 Tax=Rhodohalobacter halophilus TaxID=1812810 RepID=UPI000B35ED86|nr:DNA-processing protein DprA [Rhodohalobacter halophilus]